MREDEDEMEGQKNRFREYLHKMQEEEEE
jgi:hypothetical protein